MAAARSELRDGMRVEWDVPVLMDDGLVLRADVFRPPQDGRYPVILSYGPYAKGLAFQDGYPSAWQRMVAEHPDVAFGSSNKYQSWEVVDPEKWVPAGYACVRVDSRGAGRSPGYLDAWSAREAKDIAACVDWAGTQPWSNGKVGLNGISYYSMNQWQAAPLKPKHLAAICVWEGSSDYYRELCRHGGIQSDFLSTWYPRQVTAVQHGVGERGAKSVVTGEPVAGPPTLPEPELAKNRADSDGEATRRELIDDYYRPRLPKFEDIEVPLLSAANWAHHLHTRANFEAYTEAGSTQKWLEVHGLEHWTLFYQEYGLDLQKRFFGHFLHGHDTGWEDQPPVTLNVRHVDGSFERRGEQEWPLARTQWTKLYLDPNDLTLSKTDPGHPGSRSFEALGEYGDRNASSSWLTEKVRCALAAQLAHAHAGLGNALSVILLDPIIEDTIAGNVRATDDVFALHGYPLVGSGSVKATGKRLWAFSPEPSMKRTVPFSATSQTSSAPAAR